MPAGTLKNIIVCVPKNPNTGNSTTPCATINNVRHVPAMQNVFIVDASLQPSLTAIQAANNGTIDYTVAGGAFAASFTLVMMIWLASKKIGLVLSLLKTKS